MGVSILLFIFVFVASTTAYLARRNPKASYENLDMLVFLTLLCMALDAMAAGSRVADLYHPQVFLNPNLFFPLVVLPEMLEIIIMSVPFLLARMALGAGYSRHMELAFPPNGPTVDLEGFKQ
jgi:sterol desaturase/sphingolipid hydroxylase (fatty acid hydroxylase superfamily)